MNKAPPQTIFLEWESTKNSSARDLAEHMLYAVDAKKKMRLAKDYKLKDDDVVKIVSAAK